MTIPSDAHLLGMWSPAVYQWPMIPIHALLLPDGRLLTYGTDEQGLLTAYFKYDVWDGNRAPDTGHRTLSNQTRTDLFCSSQVLLQNGDVFIAGGDTWNGAEVTYTGNNSTTLFDSSTNGLTVGPNLYRPRWYATSITLPNGEVFVQGGTGGGDLPEVRETSGKMRLLTGASTAGLNASYPRTWVAPDGRVFGYDVASKMYYVETSGTGKLTPAGSLDDFLPAGAAGSDDSAVMYRPGRILHIGGAYSAAFVIDINGPSPVISQAGTLSSRRRLVNTTVLPDGKVLATGGSAVYNTTTGLNNRAEIWDPTTNRWAVGPAGQLGRLYHSMAVLLPDGSVMVGGGGGYGPFTNLNVELYYPPYLFKPNGQFAPRPDISLAPGAISIGKSFDVNVASDDGIGKVVLIKTASVTHGFNMEQRYMELSFAANGNRLKVNAPSSGADAPPGFYHLFVLDRGGVPSVSHILRIGPA